MVEVYKNLFVGDELDYQAVEHRPGWRILQCCKEPYHRQAVGYSTAGAPKDHPEYLSALRGRRLILNMVDADRPEFFPDAMIHAGLMHIACGLSGGEETLVHCNQGLSRGPGMAMLYLVMSGRLPKVGAFEKFQELYPRFNPKSGIRGVIEKRLQ